MIESIRIQDFENYVDSTFDFTVGFNLVRGLSNSGKTSIVRALNLAAYNDFDPRSLRVGAENCKITVKTERGEVKVTRGKDNIWEITPKGKEPLPPFKSIGKNVLEEAAEIIGFHVVELGDSQIKVNVSDQLEGHFMMDELEGKKASGSTRAQIIDEISGLTGIETLIKSVSLDNSRNSREIKKLEQANKDLEAKKHDEKQLQAEQSLLERVQQHLQLSDEKQADAEKVEGFSLGCGLLNEQLEKLQKEHDELIDPKKAEDPLKRAEEALRASESAREAVEDMVTIDGEIQEAEKRFKELPDVAVPERLIPEIEARFSQISALNAFAEEYNEILEARSELQERLSLAESAFQEALREEKEILDSIEVCPVFLHPITASCSGIVRMPVSRKDLLEDRI